MKTLLLIATIQAGAVATGYALGLYTVESIRYSLYHWEYMALAALVLLSVGLRSRREPGNGGLPMTFDRITRDPAVQGGRPCVRDTGVSVGSILGRMLEGRTRAELLADHQELVSADIDQAFDFTKQQLRTGELPDVEND